MSKPKIYHLAGANHSGRGIKMRSLDPDETMDIAGIAAKVVGKDASKEEYQAQNMREMLKRAVVATTKNPGYKSIDDVKKKDVEWIQLDPFKIESKEQKYSDYFTSKDMSAIVGLAFRQNEITKDELDAIEGKGQED